MSREEDEIEKTQDERKKMALNSVTYDVDLYGSDRPEVESIIPVYKDGENSAEIYNDVASKLPSYTAPNSVVNEVAGVDDGNDRFRRPQRIIDQESDYQRRRLKFVISPPRNDAFGSGDETPDVSVRTYSDVMREEALKREKEDTLRLIAKKKEGLKRNRWEDQGDGGKVVKKAKIVSSDWDLPPTPSQLNDSETPKKQRSRWDESPATMGSVIPMSGEYTPGVTPFGGSELATPTPGQINMRGPMTPELYNLMRWERDIEDRNRPLTDEELDSMLSMEGYKVLEPPVCYVPIRTPARKLLATPTPMGTPFYGIPEEVRGQQFDVPKELPGGLPTMKPEDIDIFQSLMDDVNEKELSVEAVRTTLSKDLTKRNLMDNFHLFIVNILNNR